ncbi:MAG: hypothetical protein AAGC60_10585 [Acidobacteriota bacterium]
MSKVSSLSHLTLSLVLGLVAFVPQVLSAVELSVLTEAVTTKQPTEVLAVGLVPQASAPGDATVEVDVDTIRLVLEVRASVGSVFITEVFELPPLDQPGDYALELVIADRDSGARTQVASSSLTAVEGVEILVDSAFVGSEGVDLAFEGETSATRPCAGLRAEPTLHPRPPGDDSVGTAIAVLESECNILPEPPGPFRLEAEVDLFPPGTWRVDVVDSEGRLLGRRTIDVLSRTPFMRDGKFALFVDWQDFDGRTGVGASAVQPTDDSTLLYFFEPETWELMVKVLDGCAINGHYWVFGAAATNVRFDLVVADTESFETWEYINPLGEFSPAFADVEAFPCD